MGKEYTIQGVKVSFPYEKAYPSQIAMMSKIVDALSKGRNALLESPTGSGKSLALLCASLAWQEREAIRVKEYNEAIREKILEGVAEGLYDGDEDDDAEEEQDAGREELSGGGFLTSGVPSMGSSSSARPKKKRVPKIYFGTRTHKQITQIIRELKRTSYRDTPMTLLGSREHACVHPQVSKLKSSKTEACKELTDRRNNENSSGCLFLNNVKSKMFSHACLSSHRKSSEAWDLEDLIKVGKKTRTCPYFVTRELMPSARIVFCPYNYLIEPMIRKSLSLSLKGNIVILDEAHNIEDSARSAASFTMTQDQVKETMKDCEAMSKVELPEHYTSLASLCSKISNWIDGSCSSLNDYSDFNSSSKIWSGTEILATFRLFGLDEKEFNGLSKTLGEVVEARSAAMSEASEGGRDRKAPPPPILSNTSLGLIEGFFLVLGYLFLEGTRYRDDYRVALARAQTKKTFKKQPNSNGFFSKGSGSSLTLGHTFSLHFWCLNPAIGFLGLKDEIRSVVLTSGTLSPMNSFASELDVSFPITLEASHVIDRRQLFISALSTGPRGHSLNATYSNTESFAFQDELGRCILEICESSRNGILLFLPSYRLLNKLSERWSMTGLWEEIQRTKIILSEPRFAHEFEDTLRHYTDIIEETAESNSSGSSVNGALLMAVCRGKVSEGIDFADNMARVVVCVGIPFPNVKDPQVDLKKRFNDAKRISNESFLSGNDWYEIQAFRALNQALGRCIRHRYDWGAIIMVDDRYGKKKKYVDSLSKWVRSGVNFYDDFKALSGHLREFNASMRAWEKELKVKEKLEQDLKALESKPMDTKEHKKEVSEVKKENSQCCTPKECITKKTKPEQSFMTPYTVSSPKSTDSQVKIIDSEGSPILKKRKLETAKPRKNPAIVYLSDSDEDFI